LGLEVVKGQYCVRHNSVVFVCGALRKENIWEIRWLQHPLAELIVKMRCRLV